MRNKMKTLKYAIKWMWIRISSIFDTICSSKSKISLIWAFVFEVSYEKMTELKIWLSYLI